MSELESGPDLLNDLAHEFAERYRRGERPPLTEYTERYPELATQIRELFPALAMMEEFGSVAGEATPQATPAAEIPRQLGEYRILREIGRGGMGVVYEAVQESLGRHVALKVLASHQLAGPTHRERFDREARAAARLHHTNIVPVFGTGQSGGVHYYAMQLIQGQPLDVVLDEVKRMRAGGNQPPAPPLTASLAGRLLTGPGGARAPDATADACGVAPAAGASPMSGPASTNSGSTPGRSSELTGPSETAYYRAVARVGAQVADALAHAHQQGIIHRDIKPSNVLLDTQGVAWVTDFGLVKDESSNLTRTGDIIGTIRYMAPERFHDRGDARSDVYGLGATLFEMLTLRPAFAETCRARLIDRVQHDEPARLRKLDRRIPRDLETVVLKAMAKEPGRRYQTADALAEDLRRFLADRPVLARRSTPVECAWRWCRRNPSVASLTGFVVLLLAVLLAGATISNARLQDQLDRAGRAEREKTDKLWDSYLASAQANRFSDKVGRRFAGLEAVRLAAAIRPDLRLRNEAIALFPLPDIRIARELPQGYPPGHAGLTFDPEFKRYARSDLQGNISVRRVADDEEVERLRGFGTHAWKMDFSPDGRYLAALYDRGGQQRVWDVNREKVVLEAPIYGALGFSPTGDRAALAKHDGWVYVIDLTTGKVTKRLPGWPNVKWGFSCAFDPDGKRLAVNCDEAPAVRIYDLDTGEVIKSLEQPGWVLWEANGALLALVNRDRITVWNTSSWTQQAVLSTPESQTTGVCFSPDGRLLASAGHDHTLRLWDPRTGQQLLSRHGSGTQPQFSRDGRLLACTLAGANVQIWEVMASSVCRVLPHRRVPAVETWYGHFSPDATLLASTDHDGFHIWDVATAANVATLPTATPGGAVFSAEGKSLFTRSGDGLLRWPLQPESGTEARSLQIGPPQRVMQLAFSGTADMIRRGAGDLLAANVHADGTVLLLDPNHPADAVVLKGHNKASLGLAASPDGRWVAAASRWDLPDKLRVSDVHTGEIVWTYPEPVSGEFSPDSRWLVTGGDACRVWETGTWRLDRVIASPAGLGNIPHAVYSPDGSVLAIAYEGHVTRLVDARTGEELATLPSLGAPGAGLLSFSPDGSQLACVVGTLGVQLWDLRRIRSQLADLDLDWKLPVYPPTPPGPARRAPISVRVVP